MVHTDVLYIEIQVCISAPLAFRVLAQTTVLLCGSKPPSARK
jgi:hypothetical protein